jgi:ABC-type arginine transport system permease subunit
MDGKQSKELLAKLVHCALIYLIITALSAKASSIVEKQKEKITSSEPQW